jgi:Mg-chelatase subunit ChlD
MLRPVAPIQRREGIAAAILIDTSGSMEDRVQDTDGIRRKKIDIAQRAAMNLVKQFDAFAREHPDQVINVGIYEFSQRERGSSTRTVIKLGPPDPAAAGPAISKMIAAGDTPIGDAMIVAKRDIDATGLSKRHILVITDGENNKGYSPQNVTQIISTQAPEDRASIYFIAFDIAATKFNPVRDAGGLVLAASNESDLQGALDYLLSGKILAEQPLAR